jgi:hypothetical protein
VPLCFIHIQCMSCQVSRIVDSAAHSQFRLECCCWVAPVIVMQFLFSHRPSLPEVRVCTRSGSRRHYPPPSTLYPLVVRSCQVEFCLVSVVPGGLAVYVRVFLCIVAFPAYSCCCLFLSDCELILRLRVPCEAHYCVQPAHF